MNGIGQWLCIFQPAVWEVSMHSFSVGWVSWPKTKTGGFSSLKSSHIDEKKPRTVLWRFWAASSSRVAWIFAACLKIWLDLRTTYAREKGGVSLIALCKCWLFWLNCIYMSARDACSVGKRKQHPPYFGPKQVAGGCLKLLHKLWLCLRQQRADILQYLTTTSHLLGVY